MDKLTAFIILLEEVRYVGLSALVINFPNPTHFHRTSLFSSSLLTSRDDPLDSSVEIILEVYWPQEGSADTHRIAAGIVLRMLSL